MKNSVDITSTIGSMPLSFNSDSASTTIPIAPIPTMNPFLLLSKGIAASSTFSIVVTAPTARNPLSIHSINASEVTSSAAIIIMRFALPVRIQSSAIPTAAVVDEHAAFI